ncbi:MAG: hypothetical protein K2V38_13915 [Gemmataceae bacterium]|nr:hypothetical protein [Gemmataceae bacterium]
MSISNNGTPTQVNASGQTFSGQTTFSGATLGGARWSVTSSTPPSLIALGNGQPDHLLLGAQGSNGRYGSNLQTQFNPYFQNSITLVLTGQGITAANTVISNATFSFGTGPDGTAFANATYDGNPLTGGGLLNQPPTATPAPAGLLLLASGLPVVALARRFRNAK